MASSNTLVWAARAIQREFFGYRFDYPVEAVAEAAVPGSLHFHVFSERLFLDNLVFDEKGVAMKHYRAQGNQYNPLFVAWWGLVNLERYVRRADETSLSTFLAQVEWLKSQAVERPDGAIIWPCYFDWQEGWCRLRSPWYSAMYQGVVISALIRAYRITGDRKLLELCERGTRVFEKNIEDGGVRTIEHGRVFYEEYPGYPLARVLDGFLFSLLGLYDLHVETGNPSFLRLFGDGVAGLIDSISFWDYRNKWSWYGSHGYLCPPHYHKLNYVLLSILGRLTGEKTLHDYARVWDIKSKTVTDKVEIYVMYITTQNLARLRLPRN